MADYYQLKNQNIFNPPANTSLGNTTNQFGNAFVQNDLILGNVTVTGATIVTPKVSTIGYPGDDTAADPAGGQTITLTGSGFLVGASVLINGSAVGVVSVVSSTTITFTSPANSAGSYVLYVINTDGGTAIAIPGIQYSGVPTWTTAAGSLGSVYETESFNQSVTATGDAPITYSLFSGSIPPGATFNSNGTITGTSQVLSSSTTYTFTVRATDAEAQDTDRSFSLTINPDVVTWSSPANGTTYTSALNSAISNVTLVATSAVGSGITYTANALPTGLSLTGANISGTPTVEANSSSLLTATANTTSEASSITINWVISVANDAYFEYNTLLIPGASTTFVDDASTNNFAVSINGDTKPNSFNPYTPGYYSNYFDGTGDYLSVPASSAFIDIATTQYFTVECWVYRTVGGTEQYLWSNRGSFSGWEWRINSTNLMQFFFTGGSSMTSTGTIPVNTWTHLAFSRESNTTRFFINGALDSTTTFANGTNATGIALYLGYGTEGGGYFPGYMSNARLIKGTALYTSAFTPPTAPLGAIANTSLLTCQSNRFIDNSSNNLTLTVNGNTSISSFDPFVPNSSYSTYGSGYFDGTGDYLTAPSNAVFTFGTGDFTIEGWFYVNSLGANGFVAFDNRASASAIPFSIGVNSSGNPYLYDGAVAPTGSSGITVSNWAHIAWVRTSGVLKMFVNGVSVYSAAYTTNLTGTNATFGGGIGGLAGYGLTGYMSDFRLVKGTAVYTTTFTPPSAPLTAIANTSLLTLQNNQSVNNSVFLDNSTNNFLVTRAGNTTQGTFSPYGGNWSNYFDGTGDNLGVNYASGSTLAGNFTIESWVYDLNSTSYGSVMGWRNGTSGWSGIIIQRNNSNNLIVSLNASINITQSSGTYLSNQWNHVALVRVGTTVTLYVNGTSVGTGTVSGSFNPGANYCVGTDPYNDVSATQLKGYISNQRVVNGTAIYTGNFTPPTTPLTAITNTGLLTCQSNRIVDNSTNNFTITKVGDVSIQRFSPFNPSSVTPTSYSGYFDGNGDYLNAPSNAVFGFGTGDFTIEGWFYFTGTIGTYQRPWWFGDDNDNIEINGSVLRVGGASQGTLITGGTTIVASTWYHIALTRASGSYKLWLNGSQQGSTATNSYNSSARTFTAMATSGGSNPTTGYVSNLRIVKGTAVYTTTFTPSTTPLTAISGTSLLTLQSTTFIDNSTNNLTLTPVGNSQPTQQNPFGFTSATTEGYTVSTIGGSGYFDGVNGSYLTIPANASCTLGTNNHTIECWYYATAAQATYGVLWAYASGSTNQATNSYYLTIGSGGCALLLGSGGGWGINIGFTSPSLNAWHHMAVVRNGNVFTVYIDGVSAATGTYAATIASQSSFPFEIGGQVTGSGTLGSTAIIGYITDVRFTNGTALYTSNFVPPSAPLTAIQNSLMLTNMTSAGIYDAAMMNNMQTVADAKLSTAVSKFGGSSMYFDGTGDYLTIPNNPSLQLATTGSFTIETWIYPTDMSATDHGIIGKRAAGNEWQFNIHPSFGYLNFWNGVTTYQSNITLTVNVWYHVAVTWDKTTLRFFVNGVMGSTYTGFTVSSSTNQVIVGGTGPGASGLFTGYIDDLRLTNGYARYTSNFTAPTSAFPIF